MAGNEEERNVMMPLIYIDSHREKASVEVKFYLVMALERCENCSERLLR